MTDEGGGRDFFLICGCARSGTTLLSRCLANHSAIFVSPETHYFSKIWSQRRLDWFLSRTERANRIAEFLVAEEYPPLGVFADNSSSISAALSRSDASKEFPRLLRALSDRRHLAEKTPMHTVLLDEIMKMFPEGRVVAIARHPGGVVASLRGRAGFRRVGNLAQCLARWGIANDQLIRTRAAVGSQRMMIIRYEDLVVEPGLVLEEICDFLGVEFEPAMLQPDFIDSSHFGSSASPSGAFNLASVDYWRTELSENDAAIIESVEGDLMAELGYASGSRRPVDLGFRLAYASEKQLQRLAFSVMKSGVYPFGYL